MYLRKNKKHIPFAGFNIRFSNKTFIYYIYFVFSGYSLKPNILYFEMNGNFNERKK